MKDARHDPGADSSDNPNKGYVECTSCFRSIMAYPYNQSFSNKYCPECIVEGEIQMPAQLMFSNTNGIDYGGQPTGDDEHDNEKAITAWGPELADFKTANARVSC